LEAVDNDDGIVTDVSQNKGVSFRWLGGFFGGFFHLEVIERVITKALAEANSDFSDIDAVAVSYGPGLASSLLVGVNTAKGISLSIQKPFIGINHVEAHLYSALLLNPNYNDEIKQNIFPMVSLIVSGGHTILARSNAIGQHSLLGQTVDDAAGEAFDKVAKLLNLGYPGGPRIDQLASEGDPLAVDFPRSMVDDASSNFSFSGLKTAVRYYLQKNPLFNLPDVCASFQEAVVDILVKKTIHSAVKQNLKTISVAGGVSVNSRFRTRLIEECKLEGFNLLLADSQYCTDNAAMIAALAYHKLDSASVDNLLLDVAPSIGLGV